MASEIERCGTIDGATRKQVRALLGRPTSPRGKSVARAGAWLYLAGETNNEYGPGDAQFLFVEFDDKGRVSSAEVDPDRLHPGE